MGQSERVFVGYMFDCARYLCGENEFFQNKTVIFTPKFADKGLKRQGLDGVLGDEMGGLDKNMLYNMFFKYQ